MLREVQSNDLIALCSVEGLSHPIQIMVVLRKRKTTGLVERRRHRRWSWESLTYYWSYESLHELKCGHDYWGPYFHRGVKGETSVKPFPNPSCDLLRYWEGISRLHCRQLIAGVVSHHLCPKMVVHSGQRWSPLLFFQTIRLLSPKCEHPQKSVL